MNRLHRSAIVSTAISMLMLLLLFDTLLVLPVLGSKGIRPPCYPVLLVPFTDYSFRLPLWMYGRIPFSIWALSTLAAVTTWVMVLFRWRAKARFGDKRLSEINS
jgi:hypothetical protein